MVLAGYDFHIQDPDRHHAAVCFHQARFSKEGVVGPGFQWQLAQEMKNGAQTIMSGMADKDA
jgi:hypothetical protein